MPPVPRGQHEGFDRGTDWAVKASQRGGADAAGRIPRMGACWSLTWIARGCPRTGRLAHKATLALLSSPSRRELPSAASAARFVADSALVVPWGAVDGISLVVQRPACIHAASERFKCQWPLKCGAHHLQATRKTDLLRAEVQSELEGAQCGRDELDIVHAAVFVEHVECIMARLHPHLPHPCEDRSNHPGVCGASDGPGQFVINKNAVDICKMRTMVSSGVTANSRGRDAHRKRGRQLR
eukprot:4924138-Prymnesium_polylepis.1